jgi:drug/metabolite transporter (DMT)-like permease
LSSPTYTSTTRPLDALAAGIVVVLCLSWGFNQVATKLAIHDIPPLTQAAVRSVVAALLIAAWCRLRGIGLLKRDGTLWFGLAAGVLFAVEFILIYQGLLYTTATRAVLFIYLAPFFVVLGARIFLPADRFGAAQWLGLGLSFAGMLIAFGVPTPAMDPRQHIGDVMMVGAALFWAATTLIIKASPLTHVSAEKVMLYQLVVSAPDHGGNSACRRGTPHAYAIGAGAWFACLPNRLGCQRDLRGVVCAHRALFGEPPVGLHVSDAIVRCCGWPSGVK